METMTFEGNDDFLRLPIAEKIIQLLKSDADISPLVIDGGWGTGKTLFCKKLISKIKSEQSGELTTVYVDAFKADHTNEPLLTVVSAIAAVLPEKEKAGFIKKAIPVVRFGAKTLLKAAYGHVLKQNADDISDDIEKELSNAGNKIIDITINNIIKDHIDSEKNIVALQSMLESLAEEQDIVVFIDELDRCRPNFAVDMLELIKHTLNVKGVHFVFVTNMQQMKASVNHCYGGEINAQRYLDKFVKFTVRLPQSRDLYKPSGTHNSKIHFKNLMMQSDSLKQIYDKTGAVEYLANAVIDKHNYSLREVETLVRSIQIYSVLTSGKALLGNYGIGSITLLGIILYTFEPELAEQVCYGNADPKNIMDYLGVKEFRGERDHPDFDLELICFAFAMELHQINDIRPSKILDKMKIEAQQFFSGTTYMQSGNRVLLAAQAIDTLKLNSK